MTDLMTPYLSDEAEQVSSAPRKGAGRQPGGFCHVEALSQMPASWTASALCAALSLRRLGKDWDHEGSPPPDPKIAESLYAFLLNIASRFETVSPHVLPTRVGTAVLSWQKKNYDLELEFETPAVATFLFSDHGAKTNEQGILCSDDSPRSGDLERFRTLLTRYFSRR